MCKYKGIGKACLGKVCARGLTKEQKAEILQKHNELRRRVAKGQEHLGVNGVGQPGAADMEELVWDDELAVVAQRWTDQCESGNFMMVVNVWAILSEQLTTTYRT